VLIYKRFYASPNMLDSPVHKARIPISSVSAVDAPWRALYDLSDVKVSPPRATAGIAVSPILADPDENNCAEQMHNSHPFGRIRALGQ